MYLFLNNEKSLYLQRDFQFTNVFSLWRITESLASTTVATATITTVAATVTAEAAATTATEDKNDYDYPPAIAVSITSVHKISTPLLNKCILKLNIAKY